MRAEKADCLRLLTAIAYSRSLPYWPSSAFNFGVRTLGVVTGTAFLNVVPVSAMLMSAALGAPPAAHELLGVAMVVSALLIHTLAQQRSAQSATGIRTSRPRSGTAPCSAGAAGR